MDGPWKVYFEITDTAMEVVTTYLEQINACSTRAVWYYHPSGKKGKGRHIHGLVFDYTRTAETLRNALKKQFGLTDKGQFGISNKYERGTIMTEEKVEPYIKYMTKGEYHPISNKGYTEEYLEERRKEYVPELPRTIYVQGNLTIEASAVKTKNKKTQWEISREAQLRYMDEQQQKFQADGGFEMRRLVKIVIALLKENKQLAHKRLVANIIQDIVADLNPDQYINQILSMV